MKEVALKATYNAMLRGRHERRRETYMMEELDIWHPDRRLRRDLRRGLFWAMVAAAVVVTLAIYVLIRDRSLGMRKFLIAQLFMPVGAVLAVWFVMAMTDSHLSDIGGPVDVIVFSASPPWAPSASRSWSTRWRRWSSATPRRMRATGARSGGGWADRRSENAPDLLG
jgi:hypothetical protein